MLYVILVIGLIALIASIMMTQYLSRLQSIKRTVLTLQSRYNAEAGIKKVLYLMFNDVNYSPLWRTGDLIEDCPVKVGLYHDQADSNLISVVDQCGYIKIKSSTLSGQRKTVEAVFAGCLAENQQVNLYCASTIPLTLSAGSQAKGLIKLKQSPVFQGGSLEGILETNEGLNPMPINTTGLSTAIRYFKYLISSPIIFNTELHSPQVFTPENRIPGTKVFINDAVLIENRNQDSVWHVGIGITLVSTAEIQVSGNTLMSNALLTGVGSIRLLDQAVLDNSMIYSEESIELGDSSVFSGVLIAPQIKISDHARLKDHALVYCGAPFENGCFYVAGTETLSANMINNCAGKKSIIDIGTFSLVQGMVYSQTVISLRGVIQGYVFARNFCERFEPEDTTSRNILCGRIMPLEHADIPIPIVFSDIKRLKMRSWQEY